MSAQIQGSKEWHELRRTKIGGSDAPCLMEVGFHTPLQLFEVKMGLRVVEDNKWMARGREMEPQAREAYERETGEIMFPTVEFSAEKEFMMASMDGINLERSMAVEIKCSGRAKHEEALSGKIPACYFPQLQHQLFVCGLDRMHYYSYDGVRGVILEVARDDFYISDMIEKEEAFYKNHMLTGIPPEEVEKYIERTDKEWLERAKKAREYAHLVTYYEKLYEAERQALIELSGNVSCKGEGILLHKTMRKGTVQYKNIPEIKGVDLEKYRGNGSISWSIKEEK